MASPLEVAAVGLEQQLVAVAQADDRVVARVERGDARQEGLHHLAAGNLAGGDGGGDEQGSTLYAVGAQWPGAAGLGNPDHVWDGSVFATPAPARAAGWPGEAVTGTHP